MEFTIFTNTPAGWKINKPTIYDKLTQKGLMSNYSAGSIPLYTVD